MARFRRILRLSVWWCCLLCVLSVTQFANATIRKNVSMPSASSVAGGSGVPAKVGTDILRIPGPQQGQWIPYQGGTKGTPMRVLPTIDFSIGRIINGVKGGLRTTPAALAGSAAIAAMLAAIDGLIDPETSEIRVPSIQSPSTDPKDYYWTVAGYQGNYPSPAAACEAKRKAMTAYDSSSPRLLSESSGLCTAVRGDGVPVNNFGELMRHNNQCSGTYNPSTGECLVSTGSRPAEPSDFDAMGNFAAGQNAAWLQGLLNQYCAGSTAPDRCFDEMASGTSLSGPASVQGPISTSTSTSIGPNGVSNTTNTTNNTRYNITYGNNHYNYSTTTTTTTSTNGQPGSETIVTDEGPGEPSTEDPTKEEEEQPLPCSGANCDGPAYTDLYKPTEETKEQHIDSYLSRISGIPIFQAIGGLFDIQVAGSCPVWEVHTAMPLPWGTSMPINLVFDFLCLPWIISMGPWIRAVIYAVATGYAIRVAIL